MVLEIANEEYCNSRISKLRPQFISMQEYKTPVEIQQGTTCLLTSLVICWRHLSFPCFPHFLLCITDSSELQVFYVKSWTTKKSYDALLMYVNGCCYVSYQTWNWYERRSEKSDKEVCKSDPDYFVMNLEFSIMLRNIFGHLWFSQRWWWRFKSYMTPYRLLYSVRPFGWT